MKAFDITKRVKELHDYYDQLLEKKIRQIMDRSNTERKQFVKINPAEFIEHNPYQYIKKYKYVKIRDFIEEKKEDGVFLISPLDAVEETAAQVSYKEANIVKRKIRASKCETVPLPVELAQDFFIRNHRQTAPNVSKAAVTQGLVYRGELVAVMLYDRQHGAVRGTNNNYELLRLSIAKHTQIHGGASKLQKACEEIFRECKVRDIFSYSNATINSGKVYEALGFQGSEVENGQPHVIMRSNALVRLISLYPKTTNGELAIRGWIKSYVGGNKMWRKKIDGKR